jgi:hypothetical protein
MSLKFSRRRGILYHVHDHCKTCDYPFNKANTIRKKVRTASGRIIRTRACKNCRRRHQAGYRERNQQYRQATIYNSVVAKENA